MPQNSYNRKKRVEALDTLRRVLNERGYLLINPDSVENIPNKHAKITVHCPIHDKTYTILARNFYPGYNGRLRCCRVEESWGSVQERLMQAAKKNCGV